MEMKKSEMQKINIAIFDLKNAAQQLKEIQAMIQDICKDLEKTKNPDTIK